MNHPLSRRALLRGVSSGVAAAMLPIAIPPLRAAAEGTPAANADELAWIATSEWITGFIENKVAELGKVAGGLALAWVSSEVLGAFGFNTPVSDLSTIKSTLAQILVTQQQILSKLDQVLLEVEFQHLITRGFDAVERIENFGLQLQRLTQIESPEERLSFATSLRTAILDVNLGASYSLKVIADVMLGRDTLGQNNPLINVFADRWFNAYTPTQLDPSVPLSRYRDLLRSWLHGVVITQYIGLSALAAARRSAGQFSLLQLELTAAASDLDLQISMLNEQIPDWLASYPDSLYDGRWYLVRGANLQFGRIDESQVMYGSPAAQNATLNYTVQFRDHNWGNGDEAWRFEPTGRTDTFTIRELSRPGYINRDRYDRVMVDPTIEPASFRLVMAPSQDPALQSASRRKRYVPVMGQVGADGSYVSWTRGGTNVAWFRSIDDAVRLRILPAIRNDFTVPKGSGGFAASVATDTWSVINKPYTATIEAKVFWDGSGGRAVFISRPLQEIDNDGWGLWAGWQFVLQDGKPLFQIGNVGVDVQMSSTPPANPIPANTWTHVAVSYDGTNVVMYVNGAPVSQSVFAPWRSAVNNWPAGNLVVGRLFRQAAPWRDTSGNPYPPPLFSGRLRDIRLWNSVLPPDVISQWWSQEILLAQHPYYAALMAHYLFREGEGGTVADSSGHGRTLRFGGGATWTPTVMA